MPPSRSGFRNPRSAGFTMKELLAVLVALSLLFWLLVQGLRRPSVRQHDRNGRSIAFILWAAHVQGPARLEDIYPMSSSTNRFASSTEYFRYLFRAGIMSGQEFAIFGGAGARNAKTTDLERFTPDHNAWSVVVDAPTTQKPSETPFLISRNLLLPDNRLPVGQSVDVQALIKNTSDRRLDYSKRLVVVTMLDGSGTSTNGSKVHRAEDLGPGNASRINPSGLPLPVLRP